MYQSTLEQSTYYSKLLEFVIFLLFLLGPMTGNIINVLFGVLSSYFQVNLDNLLIAIPSFMIPFAITQLFSGAISDIKGRIPVLILGLILFTIAMLTAGFSINLEMYIIANIVGGIGFGFINPVLIALMIDITPSQNVAKKMGLLSASANLGVGLGPLIATLIILNITWQWIYIIFITISGFCLVYFILVKRPPQKKVKDLGIRTFLSQLSKEWRRIPVILMILSAFLISHTYIAINIWTSKNLIEANVSLLLVGLILSLAGIGAAIAGILTGNLIKREDPKLPLLLGSTILITSIVIFLAIGDITNQKRFIILSFGWFLSGIAGGMLFTSITYYSQVLSSQRRGALAGSLTASYFTGIALVPITLAPFLNYYNNTTLYFAILIASVFFIVVTMLLYTFSKHIITDIKKNSA
ncbi:MAG: MFS transporter [Promethearchaeota archaeon]